MDLPREGIPELGYQYREGPLHSTPPPQSGLCQWWDMGKGPRWKIMETVSEGQGASLWHSHWKAAPTSWQARLHSASWLAVDFAVSWEARLHLLSPRREQAKAGIPICGAITRRFHH